MTKDLALLVGPEQPYQTTEEFLATLADNLRGAWLLRISVAPVKAR